MDSNDDKPFRKKEIILIENSSNKEDIKIIQELNPHNKFKEELINNDLNEIKQVEDKIEDYKNNVISNIDIDDDDDNNNNNNKNIPVIIPDKDVTEPTKFTLSGDTAVKNLSALDMIRQMKLKKAKQLEEESLIQAKSQQVEDDNFQQQEDESEIELNNQHQEKKISALDTIRLMKLKKAQKLDEKSQVVEKSGIKPLEGDISKAEIEKQIELMVTLSKEEIEDVRNNDNDENIDEKENNFVVVDNYNINNNNNNNSSISDDDDDDDDGILNHHIEEKSLEATDRSEIIPIGNVIIEDGDGDNDDLGDYKIPVIVADNQIEGKIVTNPSKQIQQNILNSNNNAQSQQEEFDNGNTELNISNECNINSNYNNGTLIMMSEVHGEVYYVCSLGPDELPGLRAWTLVTFFCILFIFFFF
jgi:hypothetical protein